MTSKCLAKEEAETPEGTARTLCRRLMAQSQKADWDAVADTLKVTMPSCSSLN